jgi:hypothetical protein
MIVTLKSVGSASQVENISRLYIKTRDYALFQ